MAQLRSMRAPELTTPFVRWRGRHSERAGWQCEVAVIAPTCAVVVDVQDGADSLRLPRVLAPYKYLHVGLFTLCDVAECYAAQVILTQPPFDWAAFERWAEAADAQGAWQQARLVVGASAGLRRGAMRFPVLPVTLHSIRHVGVSYILSNFAFSASLAP